MYTVNPEISLKKQQIPHKKEYKRQWDPICSIVPLFSPQDQNLYIYPGCHIPERCCLGLETITSDRKNFLENFSSLSYFSEFYWPWRF